MKVLKYRNSENSVVPPFILERKANKPKGSR
jgi:hypothetical protein